MKTIISQAKVQFVLSSLFLTFAALAHAGLIAEPAVLEKVANHGDESITFECIVRNPAAKQIDIRSIEATCPCVTIVDAPKTIAGNTSSTFHAVFTPNPIGGKQTQRVIVSAAGESAPVFITLSATLPTIAEVEPKYLFWEAGSLPETKVLALKVSSSGASLGQAFGMDENFRTKTTPMEGGMYRIEVTPVNIEVRRPAMVMIELAVPSRVEPLRIGVPCQIGDNDPFKMRFQPPPRESRPDMDAAQKNLEQPGKILVAPSKFVEKTSDLKVGE